MVGGGSVPRYQVRPGFEVFLTPLSQITGHCPASFNTTPGFGVEEPFNLSKESCCSITLK